MGFLLREVMTKSDAKKYEIVVVYTPVLSDGQLKDEVKKMRDLLSANGATQVNAELWGKRELTFRAKKQRFGYYVCFSVETENVKLVPEAQRVMGISDSVLLYQSHRISGKVRKFKGSVRPNMESDSDGDSRYEAEML